MGRADALLGLGWRGVGACAGDGDVNLRVEHLPLLPGHADVGQAPPGGGAKGLTDAHVRGLQLGDVARVAW